MSCKIRIVREGNVEDIVDEVYINSSVVSHTSGATLILGDSVSMVHINPAAALSALAITLPSTGLFSGKQIAFFAGSPSKIASGSVVNTSGLSFTGGPVHWGSVTPITSLVSGETFSLVYLETDSTWRVM